MKTKLLFMGALLFLLMTSWSFAQKTPVGDGNLKKDKPTTGVNSSETIQANNPILIITSPTKNEQVKSPLIVEGNADRNTVIEVNVVVNYTGGSQDLGTFKVNTKSDGSWSTIPINLWMPEGAKNVKFDITASIEQGDTTYTTNVVSVRPPQKTQTIPLSELKEARIKKLNPKAIQKSKRGGNQTGAKGVKTPRRPKANNTTKGNNNSRIVGIADTKKPITQVKPKPGVKLEKKYFNAKDFVKAAQRLRLRTVNSSKSSGDNSTITVTKKQKGDEFCTDVTLNTKIETSQFKDFTIGDGPPDWMRPGVILSVPEFIQGGAKIEERYNRGPITIFNTTFRSKPSQRVVNPKNRSAIKNATDKLVSTSNKTLHPANIHYSYKEIRNEDEFNIHVNGRYSKGFNTFAAHFGVDNSSKKDYHYYLVEFTQILFSVEVDGLDPNNVFPDNPEVSLEDYVYISKVNYGRKGYFMFKSKESLEQLGVSAGATASYLGNNMSIEANLEKISQSKDVEINAFYWGGTISSAIDDLIADRNSKNWKPLKEFMKGHKFTEAESFPISYQLKNLNNELVGLSSTNNHKVETCVPLEKDVHLKVTFLALQAQTTRDGNIAHYGPTQHIKYISNNKKQSDIQSKRVYTTLPNRKKCNRKELGYDPDFIPLICGDRSNQVHVGVTNKIKSPRQPNINNSIVFKVTPEMAKDKNAKFIIDTHIWEYTTSWGFNDDLELNDGSRETDVAINDVLSILINKNTNALDSYNPEPHFDNNVDQNLKFLQFNGTQLPLMVKKSGNRVLLEGPIYKKTKGSSAEKAFAWMRFELLED
ncbi:hypothetical protein NLM59_05260 [Weeksellaceae bacterium KMM 9724]|uniref:hypothetical protein n=1 Tax=Profundicola chukchiensis TaxID=2961959 RepID=UPI002440688A|nr:hypothetical protein [Profundicola chukchiensis]MDG4950322.1 hypothetical protein [Profundicola chukchiensis]